MKYHQLAIEGFILFGYIIGTIIFIMSVNIYIIIAVIPLIILFIYFRNHYVASAREIKRMEAITRSPIHSHFAETLDGITIVRSFKMQTQFLNQYYQYQNNNNRAMFCNLILMRWLGVRLDGLSAAFVTAVAFLSIALKDSVNNSYLGLSLVFAIRLLGSFQWFIRLTAEVENFMTSTERVLTFTKLDSEAKLRLNDDFEINNPNNKITSSTLTTTNNHHKFQKTSEQLQCTKIIKNINLKSSWPKYGDIMVKNLSFRYRKHLPLALKNINIHMPANSKVGIVGRTGSGKSSFISCF